MQILVAGMGACSIAGYLAVFGEAFRVHKVAARELPHCPFGQLHVVSADGAVLF